VINIPNTPRENLTRYYYNKKQTTTCEKCVCVFVYICLMFSKGILLIVVDCWLLK